MKGKIYILFFLLILKSFAIDLPKVGSRAKVFGNSFISVADDGTTIFYNSAGLNLLQRQEINLFYSKLYNMDLSNSYFAFNLPILDKLSIGADWYYIGSSDEGLDYSLNKFGLAMSSNYSKLYFGIKPSYIISNTSWNSKNFGKDKAITLDFGLLYILTKQLRIGLSFNNIYNVVDYGEGFDDEYFDKKIIGGLSYSPFNFLTLAMSVDNKGVSFGGEYDIKDIFSIRLGDSKMLFGNSDIINDENNSLLSNLSYGFGIKYKSFRLDYALSKSYDLGYSHYVTFSFVYNPDVVVIKDAIVNYQIVFKSLYNYYEKQSFINIVLKNSDELPIDAKVRIFFPHLMDQAYESNVTLPSKSMSTYNFKVAFDNDLLLRQDAKMDQLVQPLIEVEYLKDKNRKKISKKMPPVYLLSRGKINWSNIEIAASFITVDNPTVENVARQSVKKYIDILRKYDRDDNIGRAMAVFDVISRMGIIYNPDKNTPFELVGTNPEIFDNIQYPVELLTSKIGDCDDCTVLFCSLLENLGINTALLDVDAPGEGHIYMMFDTGISPDEVEHYFISDKEYVYYNDKIWMPVEVTLYGKDFTTAYNFGIKEYFRRLEENHIHIYEVSNARKLYNAGKVESVDIQLPSDSLVLDFLEKDLRTFKQRYFTLCKEGVHPKNSDDFYNIGACLLNFNQLDSAKVYFTKSLEINPQNADSYNALGVIFTRQKDYKKAIYNLQTAIKIAPDNIGFKVNLAIAYYLSGDKNQSKKIFKELPLDNSILDTEELKSIIKE